MNARAEQERRNRNRWLLFFIALLMLSVLCLAMSLFYPPWWSAAGSRWIPIGMQSVLKADYSADAFVASLPQVDIGLIENAINDQPEASGQPDRMATVVGNLQTPVPTITPINFTPGAGTPTPGLAATPTLPGQAPTRAPSDTPVSSQTASPTPTPTLNVYVTSTSTPSGGETPSGPTSTSRPRTNTPLPPTATTRPPTNTPPPPPTNTPKPPPTNTPVPPTKVYPPPPPPPTSYP
jgi:hypothetical protein